MIARQWLNATLKYDLIFLLDDKSATDMVTFYQISYVCTTCSLDKQYNFCAFHPECEAEEEGHHLNMVGTYTSSRHRAK